MALGQAYGILRYRLRCWSSFIKRRGCDMKTSSFQVSVSLLAAGVFFSAQQNAGALAIGTSQLTFNNLLITPQSGTLQFITDWHVTAYAEAGGNAQYQAGDGIPVSALASGTYSTASGSASATHPPAFDVTANGSSSVSIPDATAASDYSLGQGTVANAFMITGGSGAVQVNYQVNVSGSLYVMTDPLGLLAQTETIYGLEQDGTNILNYYNILSIGPSQVTSTNFSQTLSTQLTLDYDTPYIIYSEADSETRAVNSTPDTGSTAALLGLAVAGLALLERHLKRRRPCPARQ